MNQALIHHAPTVPIQASDAAIVSACREALSAEADYARKALLAGVLLMEKRHRLQMTSHGGKSYAWTDRTKPEEGQFGVWLKDNEIPKTTAYRWIEATERIMRLQMGLRLGQHFQPSIEIQAEVEGQAATSLPLSAVLTLPEDELPERARALRQSTFDFMGDRTLGEAARAALSGESPVKRVTLAGNGRLKGGTNDRDDRKNVGLFIGNHLRAITSFLVNFKLDDRRGRHFVSWRRLPADHAAAVNAGFIESMELWPADLLHAVAEKARAELRLDPAARAARNASK